MNIKNNELIIELIKKGTIKNLNLIEKLDYILSETKCKTLDDCEKVFNYIEWYTKNSKKQATWKVEYTIDVYHNYLKTFSKVIGRELFPKRDIYHLMETFDLIEEEYKKKLSKAILEKIQEEYDGRFYIWDRIIEGEEI